MPFRRDSGGARKANNYEYERYGTVYMTVDIYLRSLLAKYAVCTDANSHLRTLASYTIYPVLQKWAGEFLREVTFSGSFAKGTANSCSNDLDLFISLASNTPGTLGEIYNNLHDYVVPLGWTPRKQDVSIGVSVDGHQVDLVPGRLQEGYKDWHSLYRHRANSWTQTNINLHVTHVASSGRIDEIRLVKLWRHLSGLDFPSFALELSVIEALRYKRQGDLASNFSTALSWIAANIQTTRLVDPANSNNIISDDLTSQEKKRIVDGAQYARSRPNYSDFVR